MRHVLPVTFVAVLAAFASVPMAQQRITYDQPISLTGTLKSAQGETPDEKKVTFPALQLATPITVYGIPNDDLNSQTEKGVILLQLVLDQQLMAKFKSRQGKKATISCSLFHSHTGHHYTNVLCDAKAINR